MVVALDRTPAVIASVGCCARTVTAGWDYLKTLKSCYKIAWRTLLGITVQAFLKHDGDSFLVGCRHGLALAVRTHDPVTDERDELMERYAMQRHVDVCDRGCTINVWLAWFERRRRRFVAAGNTGAHG